MMRILSIIVVFFMMFFGVSQMAAEPASDLVITVESQVQQYLSENGYAVWYDAEKVMPAPNEYACDSFLPLDAEANPGVSFSVYEIGYTAAVTLPGGPGNDPTVLNTPELEEVYSVEEALPALVYALEQDGYTLQAEKNDLTPGDFGTAYALYAKDGLCAALYGAEFAAGAFLAVLTYPEETADTWGVWLTNMAESLSAVFGT